MRKALRLFLPLCWVLFSTASPYAAESLKIKEYRPLFKAGYDAAGTLQVAIRRFELSGIPHLLLVNPATLKTTMVKASAINFSGIASPAAVQDTPFVRALARHTSLPCKLQNHGAVRADHGVDGLFLTVDMCPSKRAFEQEMFEAVTNLPQQKEGPVPVAVAMTGAWLERHKGELAWLLRQVTERRLAITWVNHSYSHPYGPDAPLDRNFLLAPGVDFEQEVLAAEALLLENGLIPSPFFRFPGLVAGEKLLVKLRELSLIPIGSDAWLAKGEAPRNGSFILVHGNGNEPQGIRKVLPLMRDPKGVRLLPLRMAFSGVAP